MSDLDDFLTPTLARQLEAEQALINGDPEPRLAMWSIQEPVTVFGAERTVIGSEEVTQVFRWLATRFPTSPTTASSSWPPASAGTWPTPSATNTLSSPLTAARLSRLPCGSPTSTPRGRRVEDRPPPCRRPPTGPLRSADASTE